MALSSYLLLAQNGSRCDSVKSTIDSAQNQVDNLLRKTQAFNKTLDSLHLISESSISFALKADSCYWQFRKELSAFRRKNFELDVSNRLIDQLDSMSARNSQMLDSLFNAGQLSTIDSKIIQKRMTIPLDEVNVERSPDVQMPSLSSSLRISGSSTETLTLPKANSPQIPGIAAITPNLIPEQMLLNNEYGNELKRATMATNEIKQKIPKESSVSIDSVGSEVRGKCVDLLRAHEKDVAGHLDQVLKLQVKYKTFSDSRLLPRKKPNEMKDKSFLERVMPGLMLQTYQGRNYAVDIFSFAAYRFNGNLTVGVGWYRRACYFKDNDRIDFVDCSGYRIFSIRNVVADFSIYTDVAYGRNRSDQFKPFDEQTMSWKGSCNLGVHRRYKVGHNVYAHSLIAYDLLKIKRFPNTEGSVIRFGIDYQISKKKRSVR